tara:strand:+ start:1864 stop:2712 length:849 start_codon:yes stop_codon:yes gene_type:complete
MVNEKETLGPEDVDVALIKRIEDRYGPVQDTDFFTSNLKTYYKTTSIDKTTGGIAHKIIPLASFGDSLKKMSEAVKALRQLMGTADAKGDEEIVKVYDGLKEVFNKYRTHLRKFYPEQYRQVKNTLEEMSTTGGGAGSASFTPGTGMQYATPFAFKLKKKKKVDEGIGATLGPGPKAGETGVKDSAYVKQFKYKLVPNKIKGSGLEVKQLFEAESAEDFQNGRIASFDVIEQELNDIYKMLSNAKNETSTYYNENPGSYSVIKPTDLVLDYIKDIKDLLKGE